MITGNRRVLFVSYHSLFDCGSGASLSMRDLLCLLSRAGWECQTLTGPCVDLADAPSALERVRALGHSVASMPFAVAGVGGNVHHVTSEAGRHLLYEPTAPGQMPPTIPQALPFVQLLIGTLRRNRPDVVLAYGGHWIGRTVISVAKVMGFPVVFWLRNCSYHNPGFFDPVDGVLVPCEFARGWYRQRLGIECTPVPSPVIADRVRCQTIDRQYVTFVNPQPAKGGHFFASLFAQLSACRPDVQFLVVAGRAGSAGLDHMIPDWRSRPNLRLMPATADPREFYRHSRLVLMPSLWEETFSRVPVEAFINGIPVLASNRGGLPENCRNAGFALPIPARWTPDFPGPATSAELAPWCETIVRLWDDKAYYQRECARCVAAAEEFSESRLTRRYVQALSGAISWPQRVLHGDAGKVIGMLTQRCPPEAQPLLSDVELASLLALQDG